MNESTEGSQVPDVGEWFVEPLNSLTGQFLSIFPGADEFTGLGCDDHVSRDLYRLHSYSDAPVLIEEKRCHNTWLNFRFFYRPRFDQVAKKNDLPFLKGRNNSREHRRMKKEVDERKRPAKRTSPTTV